MNAMRILIGGNEEQHGQTAGHDKTTEPAGRR